MPQDEREPTEQKANRDAADVGRNGNSFAYGLLGIGFEFVTAICVVGAIGWLLDGRLNTFPWLTIAGGAVGFAIGLTMLIRAANRAFKD